MDSSGQENGIYPSKENLLMTKLYVSLASLVFFKYTFYSSEEEFNILCIWCLDVTFEDDCIGSVGALQCFT